MVESSSGLVEGRDEAACVAVASTVYDAVVAVCCAVAACCIGSSTIAAKIAAIVAITAYINSTSH